MGINPQRLLTAYAQDDIPHTKSASVLSLRQGSLGFCARRENRMKRTALALLVALASGSVAAETVTLRIADQILQVEQGRIRDGYSG